MAKEVVTVPNRPKTPYSPGIKAGDYIFVSGQVGLIDDKGEGTQGDRSSGQTVLGECQAGFRSGRFIFE